MSVGMPVVSSRYIGSGLEDALIDEKNVLFFPIGDIEKAAQQIKRLESDPELGNKLASNGFELVSTRYSWTASVQAWHEALINVLSRPAKSLTVELRHPKKGKSRLDQYIGSYWGEYLRNWVGKSGPDSGPGGEWPHSYGTKQAGFLEFAANLDGIGIPEK
jgi:hypothetical protein